MSHVSGVEVSAYFGNPGLSRAEFIRIAEAEGYCSKTGAGATRAARA
jgi:hypothetical protein